MATPASYASESTRCRTEVPRVLGRSTKNATDEREAFRAAYAGATGEVPQGRAVAARRRRSARGNTALDENLTDRELLNAWRSGVREAGGLLLSRHREQLGRFLRNRAGDLADDLLQETLMVGVRQRDRFLGHASFRTYLFGIAKKLLRRANRRERYGARLQLKQEPSLPDFTLNVEEWESWQVFDAMQQLKEEDRRILLLYFWCGLTGVEIGNALGVSERAIRSRLRRTIARLREFI